MAFKGLRDFINLLEKEGELYRIGVQVDPVLEIAEITDRVSKSPGGGKALYFEQTGTDFPLVINALGSIRRISMALGVTNLDDIGKEMKELFGTFSGLKTGWLEKLSVLPRLSKVASLIPRTISGRGICQEVVHMDPDLSVFPVLKCWPFDGGRFLTLPLVHTNDPGTGIRNVGMYRMQVLDKITTGMHWHRHKVGARHYNEYKHLGKKIPVAVVLGGDPVYTYAATAPLPDNLDEYLLAGFLRKRRVELVKCLTQEIEVPVDADIVIEGYIDPEEDLFPEGPFGDHTGYYSLEDWYPKFHVTCITHRKDAVYPATIVGIPPQEDAYIAKATERIFLTPIQLSMVPEISDMDLPVPGVAHNLCLVSIRKSYPGQAVKVMNSLWGAGQMMLNKILIVVDDSVDVHNYKELARWVSDHFNPQTDLHFSNGPLDVLDHAARKMSFGGKLGIDATRKLPEELTIEKSEKAEKPGLDSLELNKFPEIVALNLSLADDGMSVIICAVKKESSYRLKLLARKIWLDPILSKIKMICMVDEEVPVENADLVTWLVTNNIDPGRDVWVSREDEKPQPVIIDGTRKIKDRDEVDRDWPNIITSNEETIKRVNQIWPDLKIGAFLSSPSENVKKMVKPGGAKIDL